MKLAVVFPSVVYRDGPAAVAKLARAIEEIGYDQLDVFDHVVMGYPREGRTPSLYTASMPILEALMTLSFVAAATERIGLGTAVLVLPQRHPALVAKQVSTLDTLSGGRARLGLGVGWQEAEYEALDCDFHDRGKRMDEGIALLRASWADDPIEFAGEHYQLEGIGMEPKPPQGGDLPIWIGGESDAALERAGKLGDGWMAVRVNDVASGAASIAKVREAAEKAGRDPTRLGFQAQITPPPRPGSDSDRNFYNETEKVIERAAELREAGFDEVTVNVTGLFLAGARSAEAMIDGLTTLHDALRSALRSELGAG